MAFTNIPANLQDMFYSLTDRIAKLETGPNQAMYVAEEAGVQATISLQAAIEANAAAAQATYEAGIAVQSANGKSVVHYSTSGPSGSGNDGDIWFQVNGSGIVQYQYVYNSGSWNAAPISNTVISNLDAGKITAGTITGIAYNNGSGTFSVSPSGTLVATSATITGAINATSGSFTGNIYGGSGNIGGWYFNSAGLYNSSATATISSSDGAISSAGTNYLKYLSVNGGTLGGASMAVAGQAYFEGGLTTSATSNFQAQVNYTGISTGAGSTMVLVTTGSRVAYTTSSERFKDEIQYIETPGWLDKVAGLRPITYKTAEDFATEGEPNETQIGFLAEDIADLENELSMVVVKDPLGDPFSISYERLTPYLVLAIKELRARVEELENK